MNKIIKLTLASAIAVTMVSGCGSSSSEALSGLALLEDSVANKALVSSITDNVIVAGYTTLDQKVSDLEDALDVLANSQTQGNLEAAQTAWREARIPWESGEGHIFGPIDTQGVDPASDSWPVKTTDLDGALNGWQLGDSTSGYADDVRGFHAIEYILFGANNTRVIADLAANSGKQIHYAHELAKAMSGQMGTLLYSWEGGGYADTFKDLSVSAATEELLGGVIGIADEVGNGKMGDPYGDSLASADTTKVESQFSWNSTTDFANNITSIKNVWDGGLEDLMTQVDATTTAEITTQIDETIDLIKKISDADGAAPYVIDTTDNTKAFRSQIGTVSGRVLVKAAIDKLADLQENLESMQ